MSKPGQKVDIISTPQQASPIGSGMSEFDRAQLSKTSSRVVNAGNLPDD